MTNLRQHASSVIRYARSGRMNRLNPMQQELWQQVEALWRMAQRQTPEAIRTALHPRYAGWDMNSAMPQDREAAVHSVSGDSRLLGYQLQPLSIEVYDNIVGVAHYRYSATIAAWQEAPRRITGRWSEVYLKQDSIWLMISVSGAPD